MKKYLLFGVIASVLSINAYAVSATVTSKDYVDTTRQATIPATGTNSETPGDTVVTYTSTAGTIGERGIYDGSNVYDKTTDADKLVTASALDRAVAYLPQTTVTYKTCYQHQNGDCILWNLSDKDVYGNQYECYNDTDCAEYSLDNGCPVGARCGASTHQCECRPDK